MKKAVVILLMILMCFSFACCGKKTATDTSYVAPKEEAQISIGENEMILIATVKEVNGDSLLLEAETGEEYVFGFSKNVKVVKDSYIIRDMTAKDFLNKKVTVVVSSEVQETYPMGLTGERFIIISE